MLSPNKITALASTTEGRLMATSGGYYSLQGDAYRITLWGAVKRGEQSVIQQTLD